MRRLIGFSVLIFLSCITSVSAAILDVFDDSFSIQDAINSASSGDTIRVGKGTYKQSLDFLGKDINLVSVSGPRDTVINGNGGTVIQLGDASRVEGFTITGGVASFGAGMSVSGTGTVITGNIFDGNYQTSGGFGAAIAGNNASPIIERNLFINNSSDNQHLSGVVTFVNSSSPRISNNLFIDNQSRAITLTLPMGTFPEVVNNTIVHNEVGIKVDARVDVSQMIFRNNLILGNSEGFIIDSGAGSYPVLENNLIYGNGINYSGLNDLTGQFGNISVDPLFVDPTGGNYQLAQFSPAIDAGSSELAPGYDFLGATRPIDGDGDAFARHDIGAFEYRPLDANAPVPECGTLALLGMGLVGLRLKRRRVSTSLMLR